MIASTSNEGRPLEAGRPGRRVVVVGFGDTGLLVAIHLADDFDVVGIGTKPCLASGQELGTRLARPAQWKRDYLVPFDRYVKLDGAQLVQGTVTSVDLAGRSVAVRDVDGRDRTVDWDALVLATGVTNGFWRRPEPESMGDIDAGIDEAARVLERARTIAVIGGGATGVGVATNLRDVDGEREVHLFHSGDLPLPGYHDRTRRRVVRELDAAGVARHPNHRAEIPSGFACDRITHDAVHWSTGQPPFEADAVLWAVGVARPNTSFLPPELLDDEGFIRTDDTLRVPGHDRVFAVGDAAATDPHRSSARNWGYRTVAHNVRAVLDGEEAKLQHFSAPAHRWGSILGVRRDGMRVFQPNGGSFRFPRWAVERLLFPLAVRRAIYRGVRPDGAPSPSEARNARKTAK